MTDKEIIKALVCCSYATRNSNCKKCPYYPDGECVKKQCTDMIDLINRQRAAIAELQRKNSELEIELQAMRNSATSYKAEIERLQEERDFYKAPFALLAKGIEEVKTEAINEFAEKLRKNIKAIRKSERTNFAKLRYGYCLLEIDNLVKEMKEVSK